MEHTLRLGSTHPPGVDTPHDHSGLSSAWEAQRRKLHSQAGSDETGGSGKTGGSDRTGESGGSSMTSGSGETGGRGRRGEEKEGRAQAEVRK